MPPMLPRLARLAVTTALALAALPAAAASAAECAPQPSAPVFTAFGDLNAYHLAPGGSFEDGLDWARSGAASLAAESEPFALAGLGHAQSVRLLKGARITTPKLCVTRLEPHLRFVARATPGSGQLDVEVRVYDGAGAVVDSSSGSISPSSHLTWRPSRFVHLKTDSFADGESGHVDVRFSSQGDWLVDDVFIDPTRR